MESPHKLLATLNEKARANRREKPERAGMQLTWEALKQIIPYVNSHNPAMSITDIRDYCIRLITDKEIRERLFLDSSRSSCHTAIKYIVELYRQRGEVVSIKIKNRVYYQLTQIK